MLPVSVCRNCHKGYMLYPGETELREELNEGFEALEPIEEIAQIHVKVMNIDEFYEWLRQKKCLKCAHEWLAQSPAPLRCPNCKSHRWQEEEEITNE